MNITHDDTTARRAARSFLLASSLVLTALAAMSLAASVPLTPANVSVWAVTWLLGGGVSLFLGWAVVYASVGCWVNLRREARITGLRTA